MDKLQDGELEVQAIPGRMQKTLSELVTAERKLTTQGWTLVNTTVG